MRTGRAATVPSGQTVSRWPSSITGCTVPGASGQRARRIGPPPVTGTSSGTRPTASASADSRVARAATAGGSVDGDSIAQISASRAVISSACARVHDSRPSVTGDAGGRSRKRGNLIHSGDLQRTSKPQV